MSQGIKVAMHKDLMSIGFQRASAIVMPDGRTKELWARPSIDGPVLVEVTYPEVRSKVMPKFKRGDYVTLGPKGTEVWEVHGVITTGSYPTYDLRSLSSKRWKVSVREARMNPANTVKEEDN